MPSNQTPSPPTDLIGCETLSAMLWSVTVCHQDSFPGSAFPKNVVLRRAQTCFLPSPIDLSCTPGHMATLITGDKTEIATFLRNPRFECTMIIQRPLLLPPSSLLVSPPIPPIHSSHQNNPSTQRSAPAPTAHRQRHPPSNQRHSAQRRDRAHGLEALRVQHQHVDRAAEHGHSGDEERFRPDFLFAGKGGFDCDQGDGVEELFW